MTAGSFTMCHKYWHKQVGVSWDEAENFTG